MLRRRASLSDVMVLDGYAEGTLTKQGGRIKTWKKRFFVFHNGILSYRKDKRTTSKTLGSDMVMAVCYADKLENGLCLTLRSGRALYLCAKTEDEANAWYEVVSDYVLHQQRRSELATICERRRASTDLSKGFSMDDPISDTETESEYAVYIHERFTS